MIIIFITTLTGLTTITEAMNQQEQFRSFSTLSSTEMSGLQNFESLKIGTLQGTHHLFPDLKQSNKSNQTQITSKKEIAKIMRQQFEKFKKSLSQNTKNSQTNKEHQSEFATLHSNSAIMSKDSNLDAGSLQDTNDRAPNSRIVIGEVVTKSERRAGEEPSGVRSGLLRFDSHPIPVTFTSLPGFPSILQPPSGSSTASLDTRQTQPERTRSRNNATPNQGVINSSSTRASLPRVAIDTRFGGLQRSGIRGAGFDHIQNNADNAFMAGRHGSSTRQNSRIRGQGFMPRGSTTPGDIRNGIGNFMRILESRLIGGIMNAGSNSRTNERSETGTSESTLQQFDPSIVINFLTLIALTQHQRRGSIVGNGESRSRQNQRNASPISSTTSHIMDSSSNPNLDSEFGPFSDGKESSAGVDPSTIQLPPMLRQTLYSYLLPRLSSLSALVETLPGVPGLDYPIIGTVPYTNFYCSNMPWPGFYADTEARCQLWHYCDLEGRQASFLCPNGTIFNQAFFVCDWWYNFDCPSAPYLYSMNERVFAIPEVDDTAPHRTLTPEILDTIFL